MKKHLLMLLLACVVFCAGLSCQKPSKPPVIPAVTLAENAERTRVGLRLVQSTWYLYSTQFSEETWKIKEDGYEGKRIHRDMENKAVWEEDYYYTGKTFLFPPKNMTDWEMLTIHYDYPSKVFTVTY